MAISNWLNQPYYLKCSSGIHEGRRWIIQHKLGMLMFVFHILPPMTTAAIPRVVFVKTLKSMSYFDQFKSDFKDATDNVEARECSCDDNYNPDE